MTQEQDTLSAADRLEIRELIAEYCFCEDTADAEGWAALFTTDATLIGSGGKPPVVGRDALLEFARRRDSNPEKRNRIHLATNIVIHPTSEGARAKSYQVTIDRLETGLKIAKISGRADELRRENGRWRFYFRRVGDIGIK